MIASKLNCFNYEVCNRKKDLHLSVNLNMFDETKLKLVTDTFNENNYNIKYDNHSFRLCVNDLYAMVKKDSESEELYLSFSNDNSNTKMLLNNVFSALRKLLVDRDIDETISLYKWNKIWLSATEYDPQLGHSYHLKDLYIAIDSITCSEDPFLKTYALGCFMIDSSIFLCNKCDTFLLQV